MCVAASLSLNESCRVGSIISAFSRGWKSRQLMRYRNRGNVTEITRMVSEYSPHVGTVEGVRTTGVFVLERERCLNGRERTYFFLHF